MPIKTADLCDRYQAEVHVAEPVFKDYGGAPAFGGQLIEVRRVHQRLAVGSQVGPPILENDQDHVGPGPLGGSGNRVHGRRRGQQSHDGQTSS